MMPLSETGALGPIAALAAAPLVGFAFGWFLERGGLANARTLAGQFYFTDLTLFKVLFSALLTAMLGSFWLDRLGVLDLELLYLPDTFVAPQAIGGLLFGAGFLVAGLCPGTSCVAAATGRLDGLAVVGGMLLGVLGFNVTFDWLTPFFDSTALGPVRLTDTIGISRGAGVALVTAVALVGFAIAGLRSWQCAVWSVRSPALGVVAAVLGAAAVFAEGSSTPPRYVSAPDLATRIMNGDPALKVFDLRSRAEFDRFHVAGARHLSFGELRREALPPGVTVVLYGNGEGRATQAWEIVKERGANGFVLRGGVREWFVRVYEPRLPADATAAERARFEEGVRFSRFFGGKPTTDVPRGESLAAPAMRGRGC